jgi:hypothetical protein
VLSAREHRWVAKAADWTAADVMTTRVLTRSPDDDVRMVARRMLDRAVKRMPVLDGDRLVGVVSRSDILHALDRPDGEIAEAVTRVLRTDPTRPDDHHVTCSVEDGDVTLRRCSVCMGRSDRHRHGPKRRRRDRRRQQSPPPRADPERPELTVGRRHAMTPTGRRRS